LLSVLRERLGLVSAKDGCAPQGQCGCCTVLVDGDARVACVTPAVRVDGRVVTTVEGLDSATRDALAGAFVGTGGSQCGFCTPGIVMRAASLLAKGRTRRADVDPAGMGWVVAESLAEARMEAGKVQGRRTTIDEHPPLPPPELPPGGVRLATGWVEPAYLEPDASWCEPGGEPSTPLANGGAF